MTDVHAAHLNQPPPACCVKRAHSSPTLPNPCRHNQNFTRPHIQRTGTPQGVHPTTHAAAPGVVSHRQQQSAVLLRRPRRPATVERQKTSKAAHKRARMHTSTRLRCPSWCRQHFGKPTHAQHPTHKKKKHFAVLGRTGRAPALGTSDCSLPRERAARRRMQGSATSERCGIVIVRGGTRGDNMASPHACVHTPCAHDVARPGVKGAAVLSTRKTTQQTNAAITAVGTVRTHRQLSVHAPHLTELLGEVAARVQARDTVAQQHVHTSSRPQYRMPA
jgi:hypothetical protein